MSLSAPSAFSWSAGYSFPVVFVFPAGTRRLLPLRGTGEGGLPGAGTLLGPEGTGALRAAVFLSRAGFLLCPPFFPGGGRGPARGVS